MKRRAENELAAWLHSTPRKPLVVNGARQVGKTWLVTDFAKRHFESTAHVVFLNNEEAQRAFDGSLDANRLLMLIGALTGTNPRDGKTLVFLDEIQECPRAIAALKLFCEQTPDIPIVAAGSLLGVVLNRRGSHEQPISWPVGKVSYLNLFPMTFDEFLVAANPQLADILEEDDPTLADMVSERLTELLKTYMFVGGMPEAVAVFLQTGDPAAARKVQSDLLLGYEYDFSKHVDSPLMTERIRETWRSAPSQLATESDMKRFTYAAIKSGARGRDYRDAVTWLADAGLVTRVARVSKPGIPLEGYADNVYFKLYLLDVGLLGAATRLGTPVLLNGNQHFTEYKGAYAEQFVCQHLLAYDGRAPFYWSADGKNAKGEIDFLVERAGRVLPIEVKAAQNVTGESLSNFCRANKLDKAVRFSLRGYIDQGWLTNIPMYSIGQIRKIV